MSLRSLLRELGKNSSISEYVIESTTRRRFLRDGDGGGLLLGTTLHASIYVDSGVGRGATTILIDDQRRSAIQAQLAAAVDRAAAHQGPPWKLPPAAAPARVEVRSKRVDGREEDVSGELADMAGRELGTRAAAWAQTDEIRCITSSGFDNRYRATTVGVRGTVGRGDQSESVELVARRPDDLAIASSAASVRRRLARIPGTAPTGDYDLVVQQSAFGVSPFDSLFAPLIELADAERYRLGIGRVRLGQEVSADGFNLTSDGTRNFGLFSRPFGDAGAATRRWPLVRAGKLSGLALGARAGALLARDPNGGVANLVITTARRPMSSLIEPAQRPVLILDRAGWLESNPTSGALSIGIGWARIMNTRREVKDVRGGVISADARIFRAPLGSLEDATLPWLSGPAALRLGAVHVT